MKTAIIETGRTVSKPRASKYAPLLATMVQSLKRDGVDNRLRAVLETGTWSPAKVRRMVRGLRFHFRAHRMQGFRLSLKTCRLNGVCFRWAKTR